SSSRLISDQSSNPTSSTNSKGRNRRRSKQRIKNSNLKEQSHPIVMMTDNRTMAEMLRAPTEIVVPSILAEQFELKHSLINMMTTDQFFRFEKDNPHDHIRWFNKITSTIKYKDVPSSAIKLMLFRFSIAEAARRWLEKEPPHSIHTWEDLVSKFINDFFPPSRTTNLRNEISNFQQEIAKLTHAVNQQTNAVTTAMTAILKQFQATPPPTPIKAVEETCVTCGDAHPNTVANPKGELKATTTYSGLVIDGPTIPTPSRSINPEEDDCVEETFTDPDLAEYTIKQEKDEVQIHKFWQMFKKLHINITLADALILMPKYQKMLKSLLSNKEKLQELANTPLNENRSAVILKKLPKKLKDPGKFLISCGFSKLKCKALADLADFVIVDYESDPRVLLILGRPFLRTVCALIDVHEIEYLLYQDKDSSLKDSIDQKNHAHLADIFIDSIPAMFTDEHTLDYSSPSIFDVYADDFLEVESDARNVYDDPFDSMGEKIKESKLLIDELDLPCHFHPPPEYDSFISLDFSKVDALPSTNNEDKIFNPGILIQEKPVEIITHVVQDKKLAISNASLVFEDFDPPFYEPLFFKEVPKTPTSWMFLITTFTPLINSSMEELGQAKRPKTSASWEAPHAYP
nr:reverse transcriptase domain-containing protein [Tanacetum cinerariifolium]